VGLVYASYCVGGIVKFFYPLWVVYTNSLWWVDLLPCFFYRKNNNPSANPRTRIDPETSRFMPRLCQEKWIESFSGLWHFHILPDECIYIYI